MSEIGLTTDERLKRLEEWGVIEWAPDKSELFLTENMWASLDKAEETLASKGIPFNISGTDFPYFCTVAAVFHLEPATPEEAHLLADFLFRFFKNQITRAEMEERVIRPGFKWPKK